MIAILLKGDTYTPEIKIHLKFKYLFITLLSLFIGGGQAFAQVSKIQNSITLTGKIVSVVDGQVLEGATIKINGTNQSTITNEKGEFSLRSDRGEGALQISFLGYIAKEIKFTSTSKKLSIRLDPDENLLSDVDVVVSTGYQNIPKERTTGSFVHIDNELLNRRVSTNILERLDGVTSGLVFNRNNQGTANNTPISIRGRSTLFANPEPLIILDNFPYEGDISNINPNDIESITVLKDAAAASIWGVKAGNGVIVITSKTGSKVSKPMVSFNSNLTMSPRPDLYFNQQLSSKEFIEVEKFLFGKGKYNAAINNGYGAISPAVEIMLLERNKNISPNELEYKLDSLSQYDIRQDVDKYMNRNSLNQQYQLNVSGSSAINDYYLSVGVDKNLPVPVAEEFKRITVNANHTYRFLDSKLKLVNGIQYINSVSKADQRMYRPTNPYDRIADEHGNALAVNDGTLRLSYIDGLKDDLLDWYYRPLDDLDANYSNTKNAFRFSNALSYQLLPELSISAQYLFQKTNTEIVRYNKPDSYYVRNMINSFSQVDPLTGAVLRPVPLGGIRLSNMTDYQVHNGRGQISYIKVLSGDHRIDGIAGFEVSGSDAFNTSGTVYGYDPETGINANSSINFGLNNRYYYRSSTNRIGAGTSNSRAIDRYISYYGNVCYDFKSRYIFSGSLRKDESNLFGVKSNQKGVPLWSAGLLYRISEEDFYHASWLPRLSLRATYGYSGNVDKSTTAYLTARVIGTSIWSSIFSDIINPPNPSLRWEKIRNLNLGLEFSTNSNRLNGSIEYYEKRGLDLIGKSPIAPQAGVTSFTGNSASTETKGWDILLNSINLGVESPIRWSSTFLFNYAKDIVTKYLNEQGSNYDVISGNYLNPLVGYPYNSVFSYGWAGLDDTGSPQVFLDGEVSKDYTSLRNSKDRSNLVFSGSGAPRVFGSFRNTFQFKKLSLSANVLYKMDYYFKRKSLDNSSLYNSFLYDQVDYDKRWQNKEDEEFTDVPALIYPANLNRTNAYVYSDVLIERGDHIRLQDINIHYDFGNVKLGGAKFSAITCYAYVNNVMVLWKANKANIDPDNRFNPAIRTYAFGLSFTF